ncbi:MAG: hypothetical protein WD689_06155 [Gaiellaceae bacterium]
MAWAAVVYATKAAGQQTPTLFSDELQWTQLSRAIAEEGTASIRGEPRFFESLYVYLIAPVWWLRDTATSYEAIKYLNVLVMTSAAFPAYLLARRLVSRPSALAVAAASIAIPAMFYSLYVMSEVLAYPWAVLSSWLIVEALGRRTRAWVVAAVAAALIAPLVREQLMLVPVSFATGAFLVWWTSPAGRAARGRSWTRGDTIGLALLGFGAFAVLSRWLLQSNTVWQLATDTSGRIGAHILAAAGALTIGLGILPLIAGLTGLVPRRGEPLSPHDRAFIALTVAFLVLFPLYAGFKGAYNERTFAIRINERNLFYLAPLLFLATAIALERRRLRLLPLLLATGLAAYLVVTTDIQLNYGFFDAPGFSIAVMANRDLRWPLETIETGLVVALVVSAGIVAAARFLGGAARLVVLSLVAVLLVGWNVTGAVTAAGGANAAGALYIQFLPDPPDWIDLATGGAEVTYLGQALTTGDALRTNLTEFWNSSIANVWSLDGTAPFPGRTVIPRLAKGDGTLSPSPDTPYLLADAGIQPVGEAVAGFGTLRLVPLDGPIRLRESLQGVDAETWMGEFGAYNRFAEGEGGVVVVTLSRTAFCPDPDVAPPPARVRVTVGPLRIGLVNGERQPVLADAPWASRSGTVPNCEQRNLTLPVRGAPWRAEIQLEGTFKPADFGFPDTRTLGAMVSFRYEPARSG